MREVSNLPDGSLDTTELREKFRPSNPHDYESYTSLVCIENSHNYLGGVVIPLEWLDQVKQIFNYVLSFSYLSCMSIVYVYFITKYLCCVIIMFNKIK